MATGQEPVSAANIRALYQKMAGGGVDSSWISDLKELRKEMGLGDTLGVLPIENMQLKVSDEVSGLSAADGYAISPKGVYDFMNELLNREKSGARIYIKAQNGSGAYTPSVVGDAFSVNDGKLNVLKSGVYVMSFGGYANVRKEYVLVRALVGNTSVTIAGMAKGSSFSSSSGSSTAALSGTIRVALNAGDVISMDYVSDGESSYAPQIYGTLFITEA